MVRYLFYTIGDLTYQSPLVRILGHLNLRNSLLTIVFFQLEDAWTSKIF